MKITVTQAEYKNDYYVAYRRIPGTRQFAITARSASKSSHLWTRKADGIIIHHTDNYGHCPQTDINFVIVDDNLREKEAKLLKEFMIGAKMSTGFKKVANGFVPKKIWQGGDWPVTVPAKPGTIKTLTQQEIDDLRKLKRNFKTCNQGGTNVVINGNRAVIFTAGDLTTNISNIDINYGWGRKQSWSEAQPGVEIFVIPNEKECNRLKKAGQSLPGRSFIHA